MNNNQKLPGYEYEKVPIKENIPDIENNKPKYGYGVRHIQLVIFLLCLTVNIIGRGHMGVTIVAMTSTQTEKTDIVNATDNNNTSFNDTSVLDFMNSTITEIELNDNKSINIEVPSSNINTDTGPVVYDWPKSVQEMVLNAFFLGYSIVMFPMGLLCQRYGGKLPMQLSLLVNAIVSIVTPWLTTWGGWKAVCCCRILQGFAQAGTYPSIQALLAKWVPAEERATLSSCVYTGLTVGTVIAFHIAGFLSASRWGWPSTFYAIGLICFLCFILLTAFGAASPMDHKSISEAERDYIMGANNAGNTKKLKTPWRSIATSKPLWGTMATHIGSSVSFVFFFNQVPTYIHYILGVNVKNSGLLSSLPYVVSIFTLIGFGWVSDYFINHDIVSTKNARKICNSIAQFGIAFCLILTSYTNNIAVAVTCLVVALAANMGIHLGWMVNYIDLAPNFSSTLTASGNTLATIFIVITPVVVSYVVTDTTNIIQWRIMFFIVSGITLLCNAVFIVLMSADIQPWNNSDNHETSVEEAVNEKKNEKR